MDAYTRGWIAGIREAAGLLESASADVFAILADRVRASIANHLRLIADRAEEDVRKQDETRQLRPADRDGRGA